MASTAFNRHLSPHPKGDVRYTPTPDEKIADTRAVTLEDVTKFYRDFYGASNSEWTMIGDFDQREIAALLTELFGKWKSPRPFKRVPSVAADVAPMNREFETPDKKNAFFTAGLTLRLRDDHADYPALLIGNS